MVLRFTLVAVILIWVNVNAPNVLAEGGQLGESFPETEQGSIPEEGEAEISIDEVNEALISIDEVNEALISSNEGDYEADPIENRIYIDREMPVYDNKGDSKHITVIAPQTVNIIDKEEDWLLIETYLGEKWINLTELRLSVSLNVPIYNQRELGYPTGCEIIATAMMINYTSLASVKDLVSEMPRSQNPKYGFRGDPLTKGGFTIYPQALVDLTVKYIGSAQDMSGCKMEDLKKKLNDNIPVVAWVNGLGFNVHAICLTGYDKSGFYYNDPWTGQKDAFIAYTDFYTIWNKPIYDSIYGNSYPTRKALSYN